MRTNLMNSTSWTQVLRGPNDRGGGGSGEDENLDEDNLDEDEGEGDEDDSDDDDEINDDDEDALEAIFKGGKDDDGSDDDSDEEDLEETQKALATEMANAVKQFVIPEDMIPEDFNPSDPKQLRTVLANVQQATMRSTMAIMFKPIQASFERMNRDVQKAIDQKISGSSSENATREMIIDAIPMAAKPGRYKVIRDLYDNAFKKHKKPQAALVATKKAMKALGIPLGESNRRTGSEREDSVLSGNDALDAFAKLPSRKSSSQRERVKERLGR